MNELNLNEMEMAVGGSGGSKKKLPARSGCENLLSADKRPYPRTGLSRRMKEAGSSEEGPVSEIRCVVFGTWQHLPNKRSLIYSSS